MILCNLLGTFLVYSLPVYGVTTSAKCLHLHVIKMYTVSEVKCKESVLIVVSVFCVCHKFIL